MDFFFENECERSDNAQMLLSWMKLSFPYFPLINEYFTILYGVKKKAGTAPLSPCTPADVCAGPVRAPHTAQQEVFSVVFSFSSGGYYEESFYGTANMMPISCLEGGNWRIPPCISPLRCQMRHMTDIYGGAGGGCYY